MGNGTSLLLEEEEETSDDDVVQSGAAKSEVEEGQMVAPPPPFVGEVAAIGGQPLGDGGVLLGYLAASVQRTTLLSCEAFGGDGVVRCCLGRGGGCDR